jgi:hypothetical protein
MLYEGRGDEELARALNKIRAQLSRAKDRVRVLYPNARIRWVLESRTWMVLDMDTRETIEMSSSLDQLATGQSVSMRHPQSGTHWHTDDD